MAFTLQAFACGESSASDDSSADNGGAAGEASGASTGGAFMTGGSGASGGSTATGASGGSGGSIATAGSGGASAGSPNAGTGGKSTNFGNPLPIDPRCDAFATRVAAACPGDWTYLTSHLLCQDKLNELTPMGCGSEFGEFVACEGEVDCVYGYARSCSEAYRECSNGFVEETACVREGAGITCPAGSFAFICRLDVPASCNPTEMVGSATRACCPPFGTDSRD
jgi:hypothetical protein